MGCRYRDTIIRDRRLLKKILKSINEAIETSSEGDTNPNKTSKKISGSTRSDIPLIRLIVSSNKLPSSFESFRTGIVWIYSTTSMADTPNRLNGEVGST